MMSDEAMMLRYGQMVNNDELMKVNDERMMGCSYGLMIS